MAQKKSDLHFAVLGLGRFGLGIIKTLADYDANILACDRDEGRVNEAAEYVTQAVRADASDIDAMRRLGLGNYDVVILAIGEDFESSIMAALTAKELGAQRIISKAADLRQKQVLESIGVSQVILPEMEMGAYLARRLVEPNVMGVLEQSDGYVLTEMHPNEEWIGKTMGQADIRNKHGYTVLAVMRDGETYIPVPTALKFRAEDVLILFERKKT